MLTYFKNFTYLLFFSLLPFTSNTYSANISGLWSNSDYWAFLQGDSVEGTSQVVAIRMTRDFTAGNVYLGSLTATQLILSSLEGSQQVNAMVAENSLNGWVNQANNRTALTTRLLFAYQNSDYDGVWQIDEQKYLMLISVNNGGSQVTVVFDLNLITLSDVGVTLYLGTLNGNRFNGLAVSNSNVGLQLDFPTANTLGGIYTSTTVPTQGMSFNASKIISVANTSESIDNIDAAIIVTNNNDNGPGSLRQALADANSDDTIGFDASLSNKTITLSSGQLVVNKNLTIDGSGAAGLTISGNNQFRIFDVQRDAQFNPTHFTLRNLILIHGKTFSSGEEGAGAGIRTASFTTLVVENSAFNNNVAGGEGGGGIFAGWQANTTVINSSFDNNDGTPDKSERGGGAIATKSAGSLMVKNSTFTNNKGINGGAINNLLGELTVLNSTFINNRATPSSAKTRHLGLGGAILTDGANASGPGFGPGDLGGEIIIRQCYFEGNIAFNGGGANLYAYPADKVIVENSLFVANRAIKDNAPAASSNPGSGGGIRHDNSEFVLTNTSFYNNVAASQGAGLWVDRKSPTTITNVTFSENKVGDEAAKDGLGGGMTIYSPTTITNTTFANNYSSGHSGAIFTGDQTNITVANTLFADNAIGEAFGPLQTANRQFIDGGNNLQSFPLQTVNDLEKIKVTAKVKIADPQLGPLQQINGILVHPLLPGSPAIDAGNNKAAPNTDATGKKRPLDGDGDGKAITDIGAYEFNGE